MFLTPIDPQEHHFPISKNGWYWVNQTGLGLIGMKVLHHKPTNNIIT